MRLFSPEDLSANTLTCLMEFYKKLNPCKTVEEITETFFQEIVKVANSETVGLFLKAKDNKLFVKIHGIENPPAEISLTDSSTLEEYTKKTDWSLKPHGKERSAGESQRLFLPNFQTFLICPLITGGQNLGVLKFDFRSTYEKTEIDEHLLELLSERFASHLNQIQQKNDLRTQRIEAWFEHVILKIHECNERRNILKILCECFTDLKKIDVTLIRLFRLYMVNPSDDWYYIDISSGAGSEKHHETHYRSRSHITYFVKSGADVAIYTQEDCTKLKLLQFPNPELKESLCLRTDFRPGILGLTGMSQEPVIAVFWTNEEHFLANYQIGFQRVVKQIEATLAALPSNRPKGLVEGRFQHKTREILDQLLQATNKNKLINLLLEKARELAPEAEAVSYGEIQLRKGEPCIVIRHEDGATSSGYKGQHLIRNQGLWEKAWDSSETVVVNNQYDLGITKITNPPIANALSALSIPIFEQKGGMMGILDLCSSRLNAFPNNVVYEIEWLVQAFTSRLANFNEAGTATDITPNTQAIDCIRQITDVFARFTSEMADYQAIFEESIAIVANSLKASSWILARRESENNYTIVKASGCDPDYHRHLHKLLYSPVRDLLEEHEELLYHDIRRLPKFNKLLPLLRQDQNDCLGARLELRRVLQESPTDEAVYTTRYGVLLFHTTVGYFQSDQRDFFHIALTLIQELMKRQTLASELQRLMPLSVSGAMAAQVAHEIRNPCQPLLSLIRRLQSLCADSAEMAAKFSDENYCHDLGKRLNLADNALERINRNASLLMHFSDIRSFPTTKVAVAEVLQEVEQYEWYAEEWIPSTKPGGRIRPRIEIRIANDKSPLPMVRFDRSRLVMILTNLIKNAFEAINAGPPRPEGDEIVIGWEWAGNQDTADAPWWHRGARSSIKDKNIASRQKQDRIDPAKYPLAIYVSDNGPGMSQQISDKLFEPFFSTKARGTGLGCTISLMLMQKINGDLRVISVVGSGTTFRLYFPEDHVILNEAKP